MTRSTMLRYLINFLYPPRCAGCDVRMAIDSANALCHGCFFQIERIPEPICELCGIPLAHEQDGSGSCSSCAVSPPHFSRARAITRYRPGAGEELQVVPSIIRRHKYARDQSLSRALVQCLGETLPLDNNEAYDIVIPVPLHPKRLRWRGFNQAALLAAGVARKTRCPLDVVTLARTKATAPQTGYSSAQRRHNVRGAFIVTRPRKIAGRCVLLVDDVMTTGATVDECARVLRLAGARRVDVLALARAI